MEELVVGREGMGWWAEDRLEEGLVIQAQQRFSFLGIWFSNCAQQISGEGSCVGVRVYVSACVPTLVRACL